MISQVLNGVEKIPLPLRIISSFIRESVLKKFGPEDWRNAVSGRSAETNTLGLIFLRLICPAMCTPDAFKIVSQPVTPEQRRGLVLVAKPLQNLANGVDFV